MLEISLKRELTEELEGNGEWTIKIWSNLDIELSASVSKLLRSWLQQEEILGKRDAKRRVESKEDKLTWREALKQSSGEMTEIVLQKIRVLWIEYINRKEE